LITTKQNGLHTEAHSFSPRTTAIYSGPAPPFSSDDYRILHKILKANEKVVYDGEAQRVGEVISEHQIIINFCPYCGEKLDPTLDIQPTDLHKAHAPEPTYPMQPPENFYQCPEVEAHNKAANENWFIVRDPEGVWFFEKHIRATQQMVEMRDADFAGELLFLSGFGISFCPFCGELLNEKQRIRN